MIKTASRNFQSLTHPAPCILCLNSNHHRRRSLGRATATLSAAETTGTIGHNLEKKPLLEVKDLTAVIAESKQEILKGINLVVHEGEVEFENPN